MQILIADFRTMVKRCIQERHEDPNDVGISPNVMNSLTPEEYEAFVDQLKDRVSASKNPVNKQMKNGSKYTGTKVPARVLHDLTDEEMDAYADQLMQSDFPKNNLNHNDDEMPDRTSIDMTRSIRPPSIKR